MKKITTDYKVCATVADNIYKGETVWFGRDIDGRPKINRSEKAFSHFTAEEILTLDIPAYQKSCQWECFSKFQRLKVIKVTTTVEEKVLGEYSETILAD